MLFNSYEFIFLFVPISLFVYFYLNKKRVVIASKAWLIFVSLFFYSWWNVLYLPLILTSILFNYVITNTMIEHDKNRKNYFSKKSLLQIGLLFNIGLLIYFKYMDFFIDNTNIVFGSEIKLLHLALPLAISFYTLQQIAFLVDSYEGLVKEKSFLDYTVFVIFFPQLIAGPIVHHKQMMPQFAHIRNKIINFENITLGLFIFSIGLFKKVVIADTFAVWSTHGFDVANTLNFIEAWVTSLSFTFQIYFDFSGYTDMAIGIALMFNIKLPQNFNSPYKATGIISFWKRWHMTLTKFVTTYVYTPLVKSFKKLDFQKAMWATFITFLVVGLWHGSSWKYVIYGSFHGIAIIINHYWHRTKIKMNKVLAWFITFNFLNTTFVVFRAKDWDDMNKVFTGMFDLTNIVLPTSMSDKLSFLTHYGISFDNYLTNIDASSYAILALCISFAMIFLKNSIGLREYFKPNLFYLMSTVFLFITSILFLNRYSEFLYFRF